MKEIIKQFGTLILGLAIMSFGSAMGLVADLGLGPWDVLNDGTAKFFQGMFNIKLANGADLITFGRASRAAGQRWGSYRRCTDPRCCRTGRC